LQIFPKKKVVARPGAINDWERQRPYERMRINFFDFVRGVIANNRIVCVFVLISSTCLMFARKNGSIDSFVIIVCCDYPFGITQRR
jgi:hypothetical protein